MKLQSTVYPLKKLGEIATIGRGSSPRPIKDQKFFEGGDIPWIKIADATSSGKYLYKTNQYVNEYGASFSRRIPAGSVIIAASGVTLGYTQVLGVEGCVHDGWLYFLDYGVLDRDFLYYTLQWLAQHFHNHSSGAAIQNINTDILRSTEIPFPPKVTQERIGEILSAYDNLIENNIRRIAILEGITQSLYREWFVNFCFPDHENIKFKNSSVGRIPEEWEAKAATDVIEFSPKMSLPKEGEKPFVAMPSISTSSMIIGAIGMRAGNSGTKFKNGDTLMARITPCLQNGKIGFVQFLNEENPIGFGSTEFIVMRSKGLTPEIVYCLARSDSFRGNAINSMAGADGRQRVKNDCFKSYYLAVPPKDILDQFSALAEPAFKEIFTLSQKNKNLKKQRDMLLPKLISGAITV